MGVKKGGIGLRNIRMTDTSIKDLDANFVGLWWIDLDVFDFQILARSL